MKEKNTADAAESRPMCNTLEAFARQGIQRLLQQVVEDEVEQVLGRRRYERREGVDATPGYRNGFGPVDEPEEARRSESAGQFHP